MATTMSWTVVAKAVSAMAMKEAAPMPSNSLPISSLNRGVHNLERSSDKDLRTSNGRVGGRMCTPCAL